MKEGKAEYFVAEDTETKEEIHVKIIPPQPEGDDLGGITEEERKKIYKNEKDLSNKITKFYASNQGEIHLADSDNGKIMDMMLYGKSEQFTTTGKNLLKIKDGTQTTRGVTVTAKDGVVTLKGTATETGWAIFDFDSFVLDGMYILSANTNTNTRIVVANKTFKSVLEENKPATLENEEVSKVCFIVTEGKTYDISNILIQIEKGSVATSYEPYTGGQPSPSPSYPQEIKSVVNPTVKVSNEDETKSQTVTLPYTLNAIPVSSGGNITIDGQQYVSDYVDVERGKLVRMIIQKKLKELKWTDATKYQHELNESNGYVSFRSKDVIEYLDAESVILCKNYIFVKNGWNLPKTLITYVDGLMVNDIYSNFGLENWSTGALISSNIFGDTTFFAKLVTPQEIDLTSDQIQAFKSLATNYPVTNIEVSSDQLDGLTVFNYPISMANGWNYVKQQIGDTREYIYDIDTRTQNIDTQAAEAYVNSEYAVALTELEV